MHILPAVNRSFCNILFFLCTSWLWLGHIEQWAHYSHGPSLAVQRPPDCCSAPSCWLLYRETEGPHLLPWTLLKLLFLCLVELQQREKHETVSGLRLLCECKWAENPQRLLSAAAAREGSASPADHFDQSSPKLTVCMSSFCSQTSHGNSTSQAHAHEHNDLLLRHSIVV